MPGWINILLRSVLLFFTVLILVRFIGKRQPARLTPFSFVTYGVIAVITSLLILNIMENVAFGLIALITWTLLPVFIDLGT